jgi:hypothetical protein
MRDDSGSRRGRGVIAVALAISVLGLGLGAGSVGLAGARNLDSATLDVTYVTASSLQLKLGDGTVVAPGGTIPAGSYMVYVYDANTNTNPNFTITGPGVSLSSNLNSTGMGIDQPAVFGPYSFQTSSSYSVEDTNVGPASTVGFTTSATVTASGGSGSGGSSGSSGGTSSGGSQTTPVTTSASSTGKVKTVGTLLGEVSPVGTATLSFHAKAVKTLKPGTYTVTVEDHSTKVGLIIGKGSTRKLTLSGATATGKSTHNVALTVGKWFFETSSRGPKTSFSVVS